jgi:hypothetical protein
MLSWPLVHASATVVLGEAVAVEVGVAVDGEAAAVGAGLEAAGVATAIA